MIDERILQELDVIGVVEADVRFSPGTRKGILELVAFYRRMHDRKLGDLIKVEDAADDLAAAVRAYSPDSVERLEEMEAALAEFDKACGLQDAEITCGGLIIKCKARIDGDISGFVAANEAGYAERRRREMEKPTPKSTSDERIAAFRHSAECRRAFFAGETAGCSCGSDGDADAD